MKDINIKNYQLVLLDWDGTLVRTRENVIYAMQPISQKFRKLDWFELDKTRNHNLSLEDNFENFFHENKDIAYDLYLKTYISGIKNNVHKITGADKLLKILDTLSIKKAIVTSKDRKLWEIEKNIFNISFDFSVCKDECNHNKPLPDPILRAIDHFSISPSRVLMIGDSRHDYIAAKKARVDSIVIGEESYASFNNLDELIKKISF